VYTSSYVTVQSSSVRTAFLRDPRPGGPSAAHGAPGTGTGYRPALRIRRPDWLIHQLSRAVRATGSVCVGLGVDTVRVALQAEVGQRVVVPAVDGVHVAE